FERKGNFRNIFYQGEAIDWRTNEGLLGVLEAGRAWNAIRFKIFGRRNTIGFKHSRTHGDNSLQNIGQSELFGCGNFVSGRKGKKVDFHVRFLSKMLANQNCW
ncbi:unnamed protein product, partial [Ectocarpus sp. 6 AP-2014]